MKPSWFSLCTISSISNLDGAMNWGHKQTDLIIMDFAKAFDKVQHRRILHKLDYYGIRGSTHKWINSWLSGRSQQVVLDGQAPDPVPVLSGALWYALNWSMQHPFGALIVKLRFNKWRRYRGRQPTGPTGGGATLVVLAKCSMSYNGQLWRPRGISPLCFSFTRFIVGLCLLIKTST